MGLWGFERCKFAAVHGAGSSEPFGPFCQIIASDNLDIVGEALALESAAKANYRRRLEITGASGKIGLLAIEFSNAALLDSNAEARILGLTIALVGMAIIAVAGLVLGFAMTPKPERRVGARSHHY